MTIKPVKNVTVPKYPDKYNADIQKILTCAKPRRWAGIPLVAGMLSVSVVFGLAGCDTADYVTGGPPKPAQFISPSPFISPSIEPPDLTDYITMGEPTPLPTVPYNTLIPLFEYGDGTGAIGCVSIVAPVFMSEEEAFAIIAAVFAENGMKLTGGGEVLKSINLPVTHIFDFKNKEDLLKTVQGDLAPDGSLEEENLPVAFISIVDVDNWNKDTEMLSTVSGYKVKEAARTLAENNPGIVVFYDPVAGGVDYGKLGDEIVQEDGESDDDFNIRFQECTQEASRTAFAKSEELLRKQVEAFIEWYNTEGQC